MLARFTPTHLLSKLLLTTAAIVFIVTGLFRLSSDDDIRQLQHTPTDIQAEEDQLRQLLSGGTDNQFLLVLDLLAFLSALLSAGDYVINLPHRVCLVSDNGVMTH